MNGKEANKRGKKVLVGVPDIIDYGLVIMKNLNSDMEKIEIEEEKQQKDKF